MTDHHSRAHARPGSLARRLGVLLAALALAHPAHAQTAPLAEQDRLEIPDFEPPPKREGRVLPRLPLPAAPEEGALSGGGRVEVRDIRVEGDTLLATDELEAAVAPFRGRALAYADIQALRDAVTHALIRRGYVTSGAVVPDQALDDGVLTLRIVTGRLVEVAATTDGRLREPALAWRIAGLEGATVDVNRLEDALLRIDEDPRIEGLQASLEPGDVPGESVLRVGVREALPWWARAEFDNFQSPAIGSYRGQLWLGHRNVTGFGDALRAGYTGSEGLHGVDASWGALVGPFRTEAEIRFRGSWSEIVEDDIDLDISSTALTAGFELRQPVLERSSLQLGARLEGEFRETESFLFGDPFTLQAGADEGLVRLWVLRLGQDLAWRDRQQVLAARSTLSFGLPLPGATDTTDVVSLPGEDIPDDRFFAWLGQVQWVRRLPWRDVRVISRGDVQLAEGPLFGVEQIAVGGVATVRGYRENSLVRDNGVVGSLEARVPIWRHGRGWPAFEAAPFVDVAYAWNTGRGNAGATTLASAGLGLHARAWEYVDASIAWGQPFLNDGDQDSDLQDAGVHLRLEVHWP